MFLAGGLSDVINMHFRTYVRVYVLAILIFIIGVVFGSLAIRILTPAQKTELAQYLTGFCRSFGSVSPVTRAVTARDSFAGNIKTLLIAWLLGLSVIGAPLILVIIFMRGFMMGFTVGFFVSELMVKGVLFSLAAVFPHSIIAVPAIIIGCTGGMVFASSLVRDHFSSGRVGLRALFATLTAFVVSTVTLILVAALVEAYITPVFIAVATKYLL
ncbi:MAG TPA: stage II sporulation protein M [Firmicutes bacterium]|nr:stage II sporulation protein M [Bacillota bacterium]